MLLRPTLLAAAFCAAASVPATSLAQVGTSANLPAPQQAGRSDANTAAPAAPPVVGMPVPATPAAAGLTPSTVTETPAPSTPAAAAQEAGISTGSAVVRTGGTRVHGTVTDPDGAIVPGATIAFTPSRGSARTVKSTDDGSYDVIISPGTYTMVVTMPGFASYSVANLRIPAVASTTLDAKLTIGAATQVINVEANSVQISVDPDSNGSATVLTGKDLDALSDDPDELQSELTALAGPSAGPNGGQIYVDGFTGGQLPPKSSIREIRVNQNPFSAQFDRLGFGRVEVFTKPGTDKFHGSAQINGNADFLNTANPLKQPGVVQPSYHTIFGMGSISGPLTKWASFNVGTFYRDIQDAAFTNTIIFAQPGTNQVCPVTTQTAQAQGCVSTPVQFSTFQPQSRLEVQPRIDLALGEKNVLTTRFEYGRNTSQNQGVGNNTLPSAGYNGSGHNFEVQMSDTQTFGLHVINETRGAFEMTRSETTPLSNAPHITVPGVFGAGGSTGQYSASHQNHFELQNYTSIQTKKNFIRLGGRLRSNRYATTTAGNTNGTFSYAGLTNTNTCSSCTDHSFATGTPQQFVQTVVHNSDITYTFTDLGLYAESDWKPVSNFTLSYGIRYEVQNYLSEHHDWAPRVSFAYGVGRSKAPKTVLRGGIGIFYDRFDAISTLVTQNGLNESVYTVGNPTLTSTCNPSDTSGCTFTAASPTTIYTLPRGSAHMQHLTSPYILQEALGADQQIGHVATVSVNYIHSLGVHALAVQNVCYLSASLCSSGAPAGVTPNVNYQYITEGQFHEDQLMVNPKVQTTRWLSLFGYYSLVYANGDNSGASTFLSQPGNFQADLGPTSFDVRHRFFMAGSLTLPKHIQVSPFVIGQSGNRFNVTEGQDINGDTVFNDRPYLVAAGTANAKTLPGCGTFLSRTAPNAPSNGTIVPSNYCTGPALATVNVRFAKTFGFGGSANPNAAQGGGGRGERRGGMGGPGGGPGGGGHGGGPMMFGGGGASTGQRYNLTIGAQVMNLFNHENLSTPVGTLTSPVFGQSQQLSGGPYTGNNALQRWSLQASFSF